MKNLLIEGEGVKTSGIYFLFEIDCKVSDCASLLGRFSPFFIGKVLFLVNFSYCTLYL